MANDRKKTVLNPHVTKDYIRDFLDNVAKVRVLGQMYREVVNELERVIDSSYIFNDDAEVEKTLANAVAKLELLRNLAKSDTYELGYEFSFKHYCSAADQQSISGLTERIKAAAAAGKHLASQTASTALGKRDFTKCELALIEAEKEIKEEAEKRAILSVAPTDGN